MDKQTLLPPVMFDNSLITLSNYFDFLKLFTLLFLELRRNLRSSYAKIQQISVSTRARKRYFDRMCPETVREFPGWLP